MLVECGRCDVAWSHRHSDICWVCGEKSTGNKKDVYTRAGEFEEPQFFEMGRSMRTAYQAGGTDVRYEPPFVDRFVSPFPDSWCVPFSDLARQYLQENSERQRDLIYNPHRPDLRPITDLPCQDVAVAAAEIERHLDNFNRSSSAWWGEALICRDMAGEYLYCVEFSRGGVEIFQRDEQDRFIAFSNPHCSRPIPNEYFGADGVTLDTPMKVTGFTFLGRQ